jgi:hypothetical protein
LYYYWYSGIDKSLVKPDLFQVTDLTKIDQIVLVKKDKRTELKFDGIRWRDNDEQADRNMIDVLFATLQQAIPVRPVAKSMQDSVSRQLQLEGIKVSLMSEGQTELTFLAGGNARKSQAWFQKDDDVAYSMTIPGYRVYVSGIFELDHSGWKDKYVFQINWRNFQSLHVEFPEAAANDFDVRFIDNFFSVEGLSAVDTTKLNDYLDAISKLTVDDYADRGEISDSLQTSTPHMSFYISDVSGKEYSLAIYLNDNTKRTVMGIINSTQLAFFNRKKLDPILRDRNYFILK